MPIQLWEFVGFIELFRLAQLPLHLEMSLLWGPHSSQGEQLLLTALSHQTC